MADRVGLKHRLMKQAAEEMEKQMDQQRKVEEAMKDATAIDDDYGWKIWDLQERLLGEQHLTELLKTMALRPISHAAPSVPAAKPESEKKYKWATSLDAQFVFNFATATPHQDLQHVSWDESVLGIQRSDSGSEGVFFVDTTAGAVVVKGSRSMASEMFAAFLGFKLGIPGPRFRVLPTLCKEGIAFCRRIKAIDVSAACLIRLENQVHLLLKSFVVGTSLSQTTAGRATAIFGREGSLSDIGRTRLQEIGRLLVLDVLCNFGDRFPLLWSNRGNPGNIMFDANSGMVIAIDNQICPIDRTQHEDMFQAYLAKIEALLDDLVAHMHKDREEETTAFATVRSKIQEFTQYDVGSEGTIEIQRGFLNVVKHASRYNITYEELMSWKTLMNEYPPAPLVGIDSVNINFVTTIWRLFLDRKYEL